MARLFKENLKNVILEYISKLKNDLVLKFVETYKPLMLMLITEKRDLYFPHLFDHRSLHIVMYLAGFT